MLLSNCPDGDFHKMITLTKSSVVPGRLAGEVELIENHFETDHLERLRAEFGKETSLARLGDVALEMRLAPLERQRRRCKPVQEEIVRMNADCPFWMWL